MKYYKVLVMARNTTKSGTDPTENCVFGYQSSTPLSKEQIEEKVKEDFKKHPELICNKIIYFDEISEKEFIAGKEAPTFFNNF